MLEILLTLVPQGAPLPDALQPAPTGATLARDESYAARVRTLTEQPEWPWPEIEAARPASPAQATALAEFARGASDRELILLATLGADCAAGTPLADALWRRGTGILPEAAAVACLTAPRHADESWWPALAHLAARRSAPLAVRAAAIARLLESGCAAAWPWARAVLLTGTARDDGADPFADWTRGGRYELPKRLIVAALDARARARGEEPCAFEPNAAWAEQERAVDRLADRFRAAAAPAAAALPSTWSALLAAANTDDLAARRALAMLGAARPVLLRAALASGDPGLALAAQRALDERPR